MGFPNNERVVNKTQAKTNIRFQMHRFAFENSIKDWQKETIALFEISNIHTMIFKKETLSFNNNKVAIFKVYSRKRASGGRISAI